MRWRLGFVLTTLVACDAILGIDDGIPRGQIDGAGDVQSVDAPTSDVVVKPACNLAMPFGAPVSLASLNTPGLDEHPRLSPDERTVYFQRLDVDSGLDFYTSTRTSAASAFATPTAIAELDTPSDEADLTVSPDGLRAWFSSDRAGSIGSYDIWQTSRDASTAPWSLIGLTPNVSSTSLDHTTFYIPGALYFASDRGAGGEDIYRASEQSGGFASPLLIAELASPATDAFPVVSLDELRIYFASTRGDAGTYTTYTSTRSTPTSPWSTPTVVTELESFGETFPAWLSPDSCRLYLSSDQTGNLDIYVATKPN